MPVKKVAIIMGSDSDIPAVAPAKKRLESLGIPVEAHIFSAHRTPAAAAEFSKNARAEGFGVIIAAAGKAAHLAGALAAQTTLPVIGIPIKSSTTAWTRCSRRCRCPRASLWPQWPSTARTTRRSLRRRYWP